MDRPLAAALKAARKKLGISLRELSRRSGLLPMSLSQWERGTIPITLQIPGIAKAYKLPEEVLWDLRKRKRAARASSQPMTSNGKLLFRRL